MVGSSVNVDQMYYKTCGFTDEYLLGFCFSKLCVHINRLCAQK